MQFELYYRLRMEGWDVRPEFAVQHPDDRFLIADLAIIHQGRIVLVECKSKIGGGATTKQYRRYQTSGFPFVYCRGFDDVDEALARVRAEFEEYK